ncbi:MAG TPA: type II CAAX endopeptidase family protein [Clostridia bacterium]|nr:type II CAAX endopeptidase family protein [Clostridia bacterium]
MVNSIKGSKQPTVLGVNLVYLGVLVLMIVAQAVLVRWLPKATGGMEYYWKLFVMELVLIGGPPMLYMLITRVDISRVNRFNGIKPAEVLLIIGMANFGYGVTIIINLVWFWVASRWGTPAGQELPAIENGVQLLTAVLAIGVVPAVVEEFLFRGLILRGYERFGAKMAIVMTGILFGMLHLQLMSIPSIILVGIIISYVVYRTNSIIAGMIYHFIHNSIAVVFLFIQNVVLTSQEAIEGIPQDITQLPEEALMAAFVIWGIIGFICLILFVACFITFHIYTRNKGQVRDVAPGEMEQSKFLGMLPAIIAMIIVIINVVLEVLHMQGIVGG